MRKLNFSILLPFLTLLVFGLVMVFSASVFVEESLGRTPDPFAYGYKHLIFILIGCGAMLISFFIDSNFYKTYDWLILTFSIFLLAIIFIPGIGHEVNGARRWIDLTYIKVQPSELIKFSLIIYISAYSLRRKHELSSVIGFLRPMLVLFLIASLIMAQPDLGTTLILCLLAVIILFFAGISIGQFFILVITIFCLGTMAIFFAPWRLARLTSFIDPFEQFLDSGWQLANALIGSGRGEIFGIGLGASIQKNLYLPEPHTDFIFSIIVEELGMLGGLGLIAIFTMLVLSILKESNKCFSLGKTFQGLICYGIAILISIQSMFNIGVNIGLLPTKGLTLPFISYGGASLITFMTMIGVTLRISFENNTKI